jgi:hypothetical protein
MQADYVEKLKKQISSFDFIRFDIADMHGIPRGKFVPVRHAPSFIDTGLALFAGTDFVTLIWYSTAL